jgi:hypothetical protein
MKYVDRTTFNCSAGTSLETLYKSWQLWLAGAGWVNDFLVDGIQYLPCLHIQYHSRVCAVKHQSVG